MATILLDFGFPRVRRLRIWAGLLHWLLEGEELADAKQLLMDAMERHRRGSRPRF